MNRLFAMINESNAVSDKHLAVLKWDGACACRYRNYYRCDSTTTVLSPAKNWTTAFFLLFLSFAVKSTIIKHQWKKQLELHKPLNWLHSYSKVNILGKGEAMKALRPYIYIYVMSLYKSLIGRPHHWCPGDTKFCWVSTWPQLYVTDWISTKITADIKITPSNDRGSVIRSATHKKAIYNCLRLSP